ncbi:hypothetical protein CHH83_02375 [Bacillus sp. 7586-K]|nr:hypothetical protein CHH83_02375 [Bacillus sp. 7586-K]
MIISKIKEELDLLSTLRFKKLNDQQKKMLRDNYNLRTMSFEYTSDDWGNVILICSNVVLNNLEYYTGLEYDKDLIEYKFEFNNKILISYSGSDRADKLLQQLEELENE